MEYDVSESITALPNELLRRILSLIPLKEAVRTSILSSSWKSLWAPLLLESNPNSDPPTAEEAQENLQQAITALLLKSCLSPDLWRLHLGQPENHRLTAAKGVTGDLHLVFSGKDPVLANLQLVCRSGFQTADRTPEESLQLGSGSGHRISDPPATADNLWLDSGPGPWYSNKSRANLGSGPGCCSSSGFSALRSLHLRSISQVGEEIVSTLFSACRLLECLRLERCDGLQSVNIEASENLVKLEILDCPNMGSVTASASNLSCFRYRGVLPKIEIKGSPCLVDVVLDLRQGLGRNEFDCEDVLSLLASIKDVEKLMISGWLLEWLCAGGVIFSRLQFQFNKLKEIHWLDALVDRSKRDSLACFLNSTPSLERLLVEIDQDLMSFACPPFFGEYWHGAHLCMDYAAVKSDAAPLGHLKMTKLMGFTGERDQLLLMDLLLAKAGAALKSMSLTSSPDNESWSVHKIPTTQIKHALGSSTTHKAIPSPHGDYFFGLIGKTYHPCM